MSERIPAINELWDEILNRRLSRRDALRRATALGLSAPAVAALLSACGGSSNATATKVAGTAGTTSGATAASPTKPASTSATTGTSGSPVASALAGSPVAGATEQAVPGRGRGKGALLRILYWQAPTNLNPHFSQGNLNSAPAALVLEPLLRIDADGNINPVLAAETPTVENGGISASGKTITYKLKPDLVWSDGEPFTADDVKFTWEWVTDPKVNATSIAAFKNIVNVEVVDAQTVIVTLAETDPAWYNPFSRGTGLGAQVLPKHLLDQFRGEQGANAPYNLKPVGTGPYVVKEFKPGDSVVYEINDKYREADKPFFARVEYKGGGDAAAAARAVLQTGETDYALNLQVEAQLLNDLASQGKGSLIIVPSGNVEQIFMNFADPNKEVDGAKSEPSTQHPFLTDQNVRQSLALASDRDTIATQFYGPAGQATSNVIVVPQNFVSTNTSYMFNTAAANKQLDDAGWAKSGNTRNKGDVALKLIYQTTINPLRQKTQEVIKAGWQQIGASVELKSIDAAVYFSTDAGNPDTWGHFYADVEMATLTTSPYPIDLAAYWYSGDPAKDVAQKSNGWTGTNLNRWISEDYNKLYDQARTELDSAKQAELFIGMNDLVVNNVVQIPLVSRARVDGMVNKLKGVNPSPWSEETYDIANWYFEE